MASEVLKLKTEYKEAIGRADAIRKKYNNSVDDMPEDEAKQFDAYLEESDAINVKLERAIRSEKAFAVADEPETEMTHAVTKGSGSTQVAELQVKAFNSYLKAGPRDPEFLSAMDSLKALQSDLDTQGGYLVAPQLFVEQLLKNVDDFVFMRKLGTVMQLQKAESLGVPTLDTDLNDADWTTELATGNEDTVMRFGKRELHPHPFAKRVRISNTLLRQALMDPEAIVRQRLVYKFAVTQEKAFLTGSGQGQPLGVFTANAAGISTGRDVTSSSSTSITGDVLIDAVYNLREQWRKGAKWIFHRDALKQIRKLKDGNGQYLWQPGLANGEPGTICDLQFFSSEFAPNTFTSGLYVGILGDFSTYWIAEAMDLSIQVVKELYAESNLTGYICRADADGMPVLEQAWSRIKLG